MLVGDVSDVYSNAQLTHTSSGQRRALTFLFPWYVKKDLWVPVMQGRFGFTRIFPGPKGTNVPSMCIAFLSCAQVIRRRRVASACSNRFLFLLFAVRFEFRRLVGLVVLTTVYRYS